MILCSLYHRSQPAVKFDPKSVRTCHEELSYKKRKFLIFTACHPNICKHAKALYLTYDLSAMQLQAIVDPTKINCL